MYTQACTSYIAAIQLPIYHKINTSNTIGAEPCKVPLHNISGEMLPCIALQLVG